MTGFVRHWGQGHQPALLLHCALAHSGAWEGVARALSDRLCLIAPDLVGHGRGPAPDAARDYHDQCTEQVIGHLPDTPCHLVGHSFGATIALRLALDHPGRVASLTLFEPVLFATARGQPGWVNHRSTMAGLGPLLGAGKPEAAAALFLSQWGGDLPLEAMPSAQRAYMIERIWVVPASAPSLEEDRATLLPRLGQLRCPVLLGEGAQSPPVMAEIQSGLAAAIPQARRVTIAGAGHMAPITHPAEVAAEIGRMIG